MTSPKVLQRKRETGQRKRNDLSGTFADGGERWPDVMSIRGGDDRDVGVLRRIGRQRDLPVRPDLSVG